jgi:hypothetical protein
VTELIELSESEIGLVTGGSSSIVVTQSQSNSTTVVQTGSPGTVNISDIVKVNFVHV